jgi:hypothetical protein
LKFTYCPAFTVSGFGEYVLLVMKTVMGLFWLPSPLPVDGAVGAGPEPELQPAAIAAAPIRTPIATR